MAYQAGVSTTSSGSGTSGSGTMGMDPITMSALIQAGGSMLSSANKPPQLPTPQQMSVMTPEQQARARKAYNDYYKNTINPMATGPTSTGGVTAQGGGPISAGQNKQDNLPKAAYDYMVNTLGYTPDQAQKAVLKIQSDPKQTFNNVLGKGFRGWIKDNGANYNLTAGEGKISGTKSIQDPSVVSPTDTLKGSTTAGNQTLSESLNQLIPGFSSKISDRMAFEDQLRGLVSGELTDSVGGISAADQQALDASKTAGLNEFSNYFKNKVGESQDYLRNSGFASSNLAGEVMNNSAYKPAGDYLLNLQSNLANQEQTAYNNAANRRAQRVQSILGSANGLGSTSLTDLTAGFVSPDAYGGFTDPNAYAAAASNRAYGTGLQTGRASSNLATDMTPVYQGVPGTSTGMKIAKGVVDPLGMMKGIW